MTTIRTIRVEDAEDFLALRNALDAETHFMLYEPGERQTTAEAQRRDLQDLLQRDNQTILVAEDSGELVGFVAVRGGGVQRTRHSGYIVIGIRQAYTGQGLGTRLFDEMEAWAREHALHRLELTVMTHNAAGVGLYRKMGFMVEGIARHALRVDDEWVDEYHMARLLPHQDDD